VFIGTFADLMTDPEPQSHTLPIRCESCHASLQVPVICESCHTVQPVEGANYYELFDIEQSYDIDPQDLHRRYLNLTRAVHPDRFDADAPEVATHSLRTSARLNEARRVLADPIQRAAYLLTLAGGKSAAEDKTVPPEVLAETLMLREEIDELFGAEDGDGLAALGARIRQKHQSLLDKIAELARALPGDDELRSSLRANLNAISYYDKMLAQVS
jgi:molecular chaperone HscB